MQGSLHVCGIVHRLLFATLGTAHSMQPGSALCRWCLHCRLALLCVGHFRLLAIFFPRTVRCDGEIAILIRCHSLLLILARELRSKDFSAEGFTPLARSRRLLPWLRRMATLARHDRLGQLLHHLIRVVLILHPLIHSSTWLHFRAHLLVGRGNLHAILFDLL